MTVASEVTSMEKELRRFDPTAVFQNKALVVAGSRRQGGEPGLVESCSSSLRLRSWDLMETVYSGIFLTPIDFHQMPGDRRPEHRLAQKPWPVSTALSTLESPVSVATWGNPFLRPSLALSPTKIAEAAHLWSSGLIFQGFGRDRSRIFFHVLQVVTLQASSPWRWTNGSRRGNGVDLFEAIALRFPVARNKAPDPIMSAVKTQTTRRCRMTGGTISKTPPPSSIQRRAQDWVPNDLSGQVSSSHSSLSVQSQSRA
jgi:hypothetical protein